ncbi:iron chelate uptake ABC transporter family permease subunit [Staphylococcus pseudintermedius]|nr:iron chelate uptake ABC transporter family permease subunit [Staphylococcus pseudintermedius]
MVVCTYSLFSRLEWHTPLTSTLVMEVRLPRMLLALFAGMGLTIAGQMFQIILNNPLADSFTLGLANGATVGAAIAVLLGLPFVWVAPLAMVLGMLSLVVVMTIAYTISRGYPTRSLILAGILIGSLLNAVLFLLVQFNPQRLQNILISFIIHEIPINLPCPFLSLALVILINKIINISNNNSRIRKM